ncbi:DUF2169 domain-containing protein [Azoarcus sp. L1K30]|uniref:DUF2169 family type VI secretion system accessory protein n=1 Tax=Azoarcus sp. L1K30 TaxID=2820277 RepID=UPI001B8183CC|nr:DUF2169 domain-containing protein [Azoarcus sp. L1K30]MBR0565973.1 DUF2169 domain-containing protein [Azoarcus sp. L1K30]
MEVENCSPFPHMIFEKATTRNRHFDVMVVAGTFDLVHGQPLLISDEQKPIRCADRYTGEPHCSALLEETHLVVGKKCCDVHLLGSARAEDELPRRSWHVGVRVGSVSKIATVTGPRAWTWGLLSGWRLSEPELTDRVALHMGMAYGGSVKRSNDRAAATDDIHDDRAFDTYAPNPAGKGYVGRAALARGEAYVAAQIEDPALPIDNMHKKYPPVSFGPIPRWYPQRAAHAGTYDAHWRAEHFPYLPADFNFAFYQSAQPELTAPSWLDGNEPLVLLGCLPKGRLETQLPGIRILSILTDQHGLSQPAPLRLDTVSIDLDTETVQLVWRYAVPKQWGLSRVLLSAIPSGPPPRGASRPVHLHRQSSKSSRGLHG